MFFLTCCNYISVQKRVVKVSILSSCLEIVTYFFFSFALCVQNDMTSVGLRWDELLMPLLQKYKLNITWGDQDLINIIFHYNPGKPFWISFIPYSFIPFQVSNRCVCSPRNGIYLALPLELPSWPLHLRQQLHPGRGRGCFHATWQQRSISQWQTACLQGCIWRFQTCELYSC